LDGERERERDMTDYFVKNGEVMAKLLRVIVEVASLLLATLKRGGGGGGCIWAKELEKG
jgi:hypothetical protein